MRILVTGAAGSIGAALCQHLAESDDNLVAGLDLYPERIPVSKRVTPFATDIRRSLDLLRAVESFRPQLIFHAAALKSVPALESQPLDALQTNVFGTCNVAWAARKAEVERVVLLSTDKAVRPAGIMGASKRLCELLFRELEGPTQFSAVRLGNVLGSSGSVMPTFLSQLKHGGPLTVTHPAMQRYFLTLDQAVSVLVRAASVSAPGEVIVPDMGKPVDILDLAKDLIKDRPDVGIQITGTRPGEKLQEQLWDPEAEDFVRVCSDLRIYKLRPRHAWQLIVALHTPWARGQNVTVVKALRQLTVDESI